MIIDADSHVCEALDTWTSRMSSKQWGDLISAFRRKPQKDADWW